MERRKANQTFTSEVNKSGNLDDKIKVLKKHFSNSLSNKQKKLFDRRFTQSQAVSPNNHGLVSWNTPYQDPYFLKKNWQQQPSERTQDEKER